MSEVSALFRSLARRYASEPIAYPDLKTMTLAQWALESGWGTSGLARDHLNFGGLKWRAEMAGYAMKVVYAAHDGVDGYCKFDSLEAFIRGYWRFLARPLYAGWASHTVSGEEFLRFIVGKGYCPRAGYVEDVLRLVPDARKMLANIGPATGEADMPDSSYIVTFYRGDHATRQQAANADGWASYSATRRRSAAVSCFFFSSTSSFSFQ